VGLLYGRAAGRSTVAQDGGFPARAVRLPRGELLGLRFDNLTWVGYFVALSSAVYVALVLALLEPEAVGGGKGGEPGALQPVALPAVGAQLWRSSAWVMQLIGFTNNFALAVLQYFLPLYCLQADRHRP
jgi:hypothetical protein